MAARNRQLGLFASVGVDGEGRRREAVARRSSARRRGPKPREERRGFAKHAARPVHDWRHPVHVTMRRVRLGPSFRSQLVYRTILAEIAAAKARRVRVIHYSIQDDHLHLMVEGQDRADLGKQMCRLFSRIATMVNRVARRFGSLFRDRHHRHDLKTPTEVRNALVYILFNMRKHGAPTATGKIAAEALAATLDPCSSAPWFEHWHPDARPPPDQLAVARAYSTAEVTSAPRTWLASVGWRRAAGALRFDEQPRRRSP